MPNDTLSFYFGNVARNVGQCVSTPIATLSFHFRNVMRNVGQCCSEWPCLMILYHSTLEMLRAMLVNVAVCPPLLLLYHSTSEMLCAMLVNVAASGHA